MSSLVSLDDVVFGDEEVDAAFKKWREAIENANRWEVDGPVDFDADPYSGFSLRVRNPRGSISGIVQTGGITASTGPTHYGEGMVLLKFRRDNVASDGPIIKVYNWFATVVTAGSKVEVEPDGDAYKLVGASCP